MSYAYLNLNVLLFELLILYIGYAAYYLDITRY